MPTTVAGVLGTQRGKRLADGDDIHNLTQLLASGVSGLTALAGGGAVGPPVVNSRVAEFTTVATTNDSAMLPPAIAGLMVTVINSGANSLRLYCQTANPNLPGTPADGIVALAGGAAVGFITVPTNGVARLSCATPGKWKSEVQ